MRWAADPVAVSGQWPENGVEEAGDRRPGTSPPPQALGLRAVAARRSEGVAGGRVASSHGA